MTLNFIPTKKDVGKIIYALPQGNNASRERCMQLFRIVSMGRKYMMLRRVFLNHPQSTPDRYTIQTGKNASDSNAGYAWYANEADYLADREVARLRADICAWCREAPEYTKEGSLSEAALRQVHAVLMACEVRKSSKDTHQ